MAKWLVFIGLLVGSSTVAANPWEQIDAPIAGVSQSIGSYANGCLQGAKALPKSGVGYQVLRPERKRFYGHPEMVSFLTELGNKAASLELPNFLVADIAMPGGGKFSSGHASHQTGWMQISGCECQYPFSQITSWPSLPPSVWFTPTRLP